MIARWLLMHLVHSKKNKRRRLQKQNSLGQGANLSVSNLRVKEEILEPENKQNTYSLSSQLLKNEVQSTCRVCLHPGEIPIYGGGDADIPEALADFAGILVDSKDKYPKFLCTSCYELLQGAIELRKTAQQSDKLLRQPKTENFWDTEEDEHMDHQSVRDDKTSEHRNVYYCKICDLGFKTYDEYSEHRLSDEHDTKKHTCPICSKVYSSSYIKKHLAVHTNDLPFMCDVCGKKFIQLTQFNKHRATHFYDLPFQCEHCPYKGRFKEALKMHMRTHTGEKPYQCPQCPDRHFVSKSNLNKHMRTHQSERDFKCHSCGRGFYTKREVDVHFKVEHNGIKDHVCTECGKVFGYRKQLMKHQLKVHKRKKLISGRTPLYLQVQYKNDQVST